MKKAVMYGAGNIGRGFIGQLLSQSGYEVTFLDINDKIIDTLNRDGKYKITTVSNENSRDIIVENVKAIHTVKHLEEAIEAIATCDLLATAVGANILKYIAPVVAKGLEKRHNKNQKSLNMILCENLMHVNHHFKSLLENELGDKKTEVLQSIGFVEASIGRMVPVISKETYPTDITVEEFEVLHTDKEGYVGEIPIIKNMTAYAPFDVFIQRKLFMHNMGHAVTAYLGKIKGYTYINEAISDIEIKHCVYACGIESAKAIAADGYPLSSLIDFYDRLVYRFNNDKLEDTIERVGRDTQRKLAQQDRLAGSINLCKEKRTPYAFLLLGIAGGLLFQTDNDEKSIQIFNEAKQNIEKTIVKYTNLIDDKDIKDIKVLYKMLEQKNISAAIYYCEKLKADQIKD